MPEITIPLVGQRSLQPYYYAGKGQLYSGLYFDEITDSATNSKTVYAVKRSGKTDLAGTGPGGADVGVGVIANDSLPSATYIGGFGATTSKIYNGSVNLGTLTGVALHFTDAVLNGIVYIFVTSSDKTGWYWASDALGSFVGDTHTNTVIDGIASTAKLYVGQLLTAGTGIQAGTRIATITSATAITVTIATTATNAGVTITSDKLAKIIDADFPTNIVGMMVEMDGYLFVMTTTGKIYHSDLNNPSSWNPLNFIEANQEADPGGGVLRYKNMILGCGLKTIEFFHNAGNASGSVLSRNSGETLNIGVSTVSAGTKRTPYGTAYGICCFVDGNFNVRILKGGNIFTTRFPGLVSGASPGAHQEAIDIVSYNHQTIINFVESRLWYLVELDKWVGSQFGVDTYLADASTGVAVFCASSDTSTFQKIEYADVGALTFQDNSTPYTMTIQMEPKVLNKGKGFVINSVELLADNQSSGSTTLSISRDDYASFQVLGSFDLTQRRKRIMRGGLCRNHAIFKLEDSGANAWRGQALVVNYSPCAT